MILKKDKKEEKYNPKITGDYKHALSARNENVRS